MAKASFEARLLRHSVTEKIRGYVRSARRLRYDKTPISDSSDKVLAVLKLPDDKVKAQAIIKKYDVKDKPKKIATPDDHLRELTNKGKELGKTLKVYSKIVKTMEKEDSNG